MKYYMRNVALQSGGLGARQWVDRLSYCHCRACFLHTGKAVCNAKSKAVPYLRTDALAPSDCQGRLALDACVP